MSDPWIYVLEVELGKLALDVMLHGITVFRDPTGTAGFLQTKVNPFIIEGDNQFSIYLGHPPGGKASAESHCQVRLFRAVQGKMPRADDELSKFKFVLGETELEDDQLTLVHNEMVPIDQADGRWAWEDADPYVEEEDRADVVALVEQFHQALVAKDTATLMQLNALRIEEFSRALHETQPDMEADQQQAFDELFASPDWQVAPLHSDSLVVVPGAQGRVVQVLDHQGAPAVHGMANEEDGYAMSLYLSKLQNGWTLVR